MFIGVIEFSRICKSKDIYIQLAPILIALILIISDIINIDVTVILDGWHGDSSRMFIVGETTSIKAKKLIQITYKSMMEGIKKIKPGINLGDIGYTIENIANTPKDR